MERRLRLCVVSPLLRGGGAEFQVALLVAALHRTGRFEIFYLAHQVTGTGQPPDCTVVRISKNERVPRFGYLMHAVPLHRLLRQLAPDVIYQRVGCGYTGICAWYARNNAAGMIWHVAHDTDVSPQSLDGGRNLVRRFLEKRSVEFGIRHAGSIVVQTDDQARLLQEHYGRAADRVVPNFHPAPTEIADKSGVLTVVWIANLKPWKRPEVFVRLAQALQNVAGVRFLMIGDAPTDARNARWLHPLQEQMRGLSNLTFLGRCTQEEVNACLARAHVLVNTSVHEGFPNTFIQAWMREAVVVSLGVNPDRVLTEHRVGFCAADEPALQATVHRLLTDAALRGDVARRGREYAQARHSLGNIESLVSLIDSAVPVRAYRARLGTNRS